jgi:hypothetical protein
MDDALAWADDKGFRSDLLLLEGEDGRPLWDGRAEIYVREAVPEEADRWNNVERMSISFASVEFRVGRLPVSSSRLR